MRLIIVVIGMFGLFWQLQACAWNHMGHMMVAQIAYDNLTPQAKYEVDRLTKVVGQHHAPTNSFVRSAMWADWIKGDGVKIYNHWHYINRPYSDDHSQLPTQNDHENIVWAIEHSLAVLNNPNADDFEKSLFLRFLIHFIGDVHQPMHCISLYNKQWFMGDKGGNAYPIHFHKTDNLHVLWDRSLDLFHAYDGKNKLHYFSAKFATDYPPSFFGKRITNTSPQLWADESFVIAKEFAYQLPPNHEPSAQYIKQGRAIASQQMTLAGYRLAYILNEIYP